MNDEPTVQTRWVLHDRWEDTYTDLPGHDPTAPDPQDMARELDIALHGETWARARSPKAVWQELLGEVMALSLDSAVAAENDQLRAALKAVYSAYFGHETTAERNRAMAIARAALGIDERTRVRK